MQVQEPWATACSGCTASSCKRNNGSGRDQFAARLAERGVETRPFFLGMHEQPVLHERGLFDGESYPVAERIARQGLYLPSGLALTSVSSSAYATRCALSLRDHAFSAPSTPPRTTTLYQDKDYAAGVRPARSGVFDRYAERAVRRVLDLGCGAGNHAASSRPSAASTWSAWIARRRHAASAPRARGGGARFERATSPALDLGETFDAVLMMFAVLGYHATNADVAGGAAASARRHLRPRVACFFCDVWYGPAVLARRPV